MAWLPRGTVIVPIDFSDESFSTLTIAEELSERASIRVIHVLPALEPAEPGINWDTIDDDTRSQHAEDALRNRLGQLGYDAVPVIIGFGDAGHEIARHAEELEADLIVMPSHGRTGIKRLLIGSVVDRVVHLAHCPVLVLRT